MNEHGLLRERLVEEERKNAQLQQFIKQLQQQNSSLMTLAVSTSNSSNLGANQLNGTNEFGLDPSGSNHSSSLLIEAKDSRMKQLEIQVQQLQELLKQKVDLRFYLNQPYIGKLINYCCFKIKCDRRSMFS